MSELKKTPLYPEYAELGAKTIDFGGWDLPVQFSSIKEEHEATRTKATLFDVSHMGTVFVKGPKSLEFLQKVVTNDVSKLTPKRTQYTVMCYENGGTIDDFLIYMIDENEYLLVVNAANIEKDVAWLEKHNDFGADVKIEDLSADYAILALQGPKAEAVLSKVTDLDLKALKPFRFETDVTIKTLNAKAIVSRTGYTGEDGFEIYIDANEARALWKLLLAEGQDEGLKPAGLGARDTLRFEAGLPLYGQELSDDISPIEAGLNFAVKVDKEADFIGKDVLKAQVEQGPERKLVGIEMIDKGIPRHGYPVLADGEEIGFVTTGTQSPTLQKNIGLALVKSAYAEVGTELMVQVRKRQLKAVVVNTPFYKREK